jgi:hypothetical protein
MVPVKKAREISLNSHMEGESVGVSRELGAKRLLHLLRT